MTTAFPIRSLSTALLLTIAVLLAMGWSAFDSYRNFVTVQRRNLRLAELRGVIVHLDEVLTMSARMAATTGDLRWERRYRQFENPLDDAVKETMRLTTLSASADAAKQTDEANLRLVEMENKAFAFVATGQVADARDILFGKDYDVQKLIYAGGMATLIDDIKARLTDRRREMWRRAVLVGAMTLVSVGLLVFVWLKVLGRLQQWRAALAVAVAELRRTREDLELRVEERTAKLAEASGLLEAMLENSPDLIYFKDRESRFVRFSKAYLIRFGMTDPQLLRGKTDAQLFDAEHAQAALADEQSIIRTGNPIVGKLEKETIPSGRVTWALTTKMPWRDGCDNIVGTFGISKDVTALKETEAKLAYERDQLRALLDASPDTIYFKDLQSRFALVSRSKVRRTLARVPDLRARRQAAGLPVDVPDEEMLTGLSDFDTLNDLEAHLAYEDEQQIIRTGEAIVGKIEKQTGVDGAVKWALSSKIPWRDRDGKTIGTFGISKDITELKTTEEKLAQVNRKLLESSRQAGMAEVATGVLHNVGNVLNSVNVSATLVTEQVRKTEAVNIARLAGLFEEHRSNPAKFLAEDPRGQMIPAYLSSLAELLDTEQTSVLTELEQLRKNVEHIKEIVAMQQTYARPSGLNDTVDVAELIDDALRINADSLSRHRIETIRDCDCCPAITTDKHKVVQILINLVSNAKQACGETERIDKRITVRATGDERRVRIAIIDNGVGIPPENLTRIFSHGFTTRKDGHGFGLHSSALAAAEMGGSLSVQSDGPGAGATFTLELPVAAPPPPFPIPHSNLVSISA